MRKGSYADEVNSARLMANGLRNNQTQLAKRGIDEAFLADFVHLQTQAQDLDSEQETLKARLKSKTAELEGVLTQLAAKYAEAKKLVKMDIAREGWKEFGIQDVR